MIATPPAERAAASCLVAALEHTWTAIRIRHPDVPQVVIVVASGSDPRSRRLNLGHFAAGRWQLTDQPTSRAEVLVSGEGLQRGPIDVLGTLLHEAAHGLAHARRINDTSRGGRYHCEGHGAWVVQAEDAPGKASGAGLTLATTGRVCLAVDPSTVLSGAFSAPPACLRDLIAPVCQLVAGWGCG